MARFTCQAVLFDLDGVLVDSRACVERQWSVWADRHGLERGAVLQTAHGRRAVEVVAALAPHLDALREAAALAVAEMADSSHLARVPGAAALLRSIPRSAWAITTSAPRAIAVARLAQAGLEVPGVIVAAEDVAHGKPDPQGYLVAAGRRHVSTGRAPRRGCLRRQSHRPHGHRPSAGGDRSAHRRGARDLSG
jgi:sugar-phosphatase